MLTVIKNESLVVLCAMTLIKLLARGPEADQLIVPPPTDMLARLHKESPDTQGKNDGVRKLAILVWLTFALSASGLAATTLVEKGQSRYRIVIPANAITAEHYA